MTYMIYIINELIILRLLEFYRIWMTWSILSYFIKLITLQCQKNYFDFEIVLDTILIQIGFF